MKFEKIPEETFKNLVTGAGVLLTTFNPVSPELSLTNIIGAVDDGGSNFSAVMNTKDAGEGIANCPRNMKELKQLTYWDVSLTGTFVTATKESITRLLAAADNSGDKFTPRGDLKAEDFKDIWFVCDYSDQNGETNGGFLALHLMNALNTGGFSFQSTNDEKGKFAFSFMAHYSMDAQDTVPFEAYLHDGQPEPAMMVTANEETV